MFAHDSHCTSPPAHSQGDAHQKALHAALWIAFALLAVEVIGGWIASSLALITDALHLATDVGALLLAIFVIRVAHLPRTSTMSYGYHRAEILGALASALSLWVLCGVLMYEAILRLIHPIPVQGSIVFFIASVGLVANLAMMRVLHPGQATNLSMRAAYLHVLGDLLGSLGVILAGGLIWLTHFYPLDPLITILFNFSILYGSGKIIKQTVSILMEACPPGYDPDAITKDLLTLPGVKEVHDLHIWSVGTHAIALSCHIISENPLTLQGAHRILEQKHQIHHMTLQIEDPTSFEAKYCYDCE